MRKLIYAILAVATLSVVTTACSTDVDDGYSDWRKYNETWMSELSKKTNADGTPYYTTVVAPWDPEAFILVRNCGEVHTSNLKPLYTSTTKVNYTLSLANDTVADKGTNFVSQLNSSGLISGWGLAIMQMHVGDSIEAIIPYDLAYGTSGTGAISPYSNLRFNIRLVDITAYEVRP